MTTPRRDGNDTPFHNWLRKHKELDSIRNRLAVTDVDYWFHKYAHHTDRNGVRGVDQIMAVELKTWNRELPHAQRDTLLIVNQLLRYAHAKQQGYRRIGDAITLRARRSTVKVRGSRPGEVRNVIVYGVYLLQLSHAEPETSSEIRWNGKMIDVSTLVRLLRFDLDPDHPTERISMRRQHAYGTARNYTLNFPERHEETRFTPITRT